LRRWSLRSQRVIAPPKPFFLFFSASSKSAICHAELWLFSTGLKHATIAFPEFSAAGWELSTQERQQENQRFSKRSER